jgi:adenosine deaminase
MPSEEEFIRGLPKAELHVHVEGTLEPELAFRLRDADDFHALARSYLRKAHGEGVVHAEMFFDPQTHASRGIDLATVLEGLTRAQHEAEQESGITSRLILCFLRHLSAEEAMRTLEDALPYRNAIAAVGLDSSEVGNPPSKFAKVFARARDAGLPAVAHAGEEGPPTYIVEALDILQVRRIDHGVRCEEDPALLARLARERIPLTVCPLSNVKLNVFASIADHNIKRLLARGICVTVNSDDPAYFGGYLVANFSALERGLGLSRAELTTLARNSIEASFLEDSAKRHWYRAIDAYTAGAAAQ